MKMDKLTLTIESPIICDDNRTLLLLEKYCSYYNFLKRRLLNDMLNNEITNEYRNNLKRYYISHYKIPGRLYNSLKIDVEGNINSVKELKKDNKNTISSRIKKLTKRIDKFSKYLKKGFRKKRKEEILPHESRMYKNNIFLWKQKINRLNDRRRLIDGNLSIMYGSKLFYRKQWNHGDHNEWLKEWKRRRNLSCYIVGSKDETAGNNLCQYKQKESLISLRLPYNLETNNQRYIKLSVRFHSEREKKNTNYYDYFHEAVNCGKALTYRIIKKENDKWYVLVTFRLDREINYNISGYIGIDINHELIATSTIDNKGNFIQFKNYNYKTKEITSNNLSNQLGLIVKSIVNQAITENKGVVIEKLNLKKLKLKDKGKKLNLKLHTICYQKFFTLLRSKCGKNGTLLKSVNSAYTSVIGRYKYSKFYGIGIHNSAAIVIARRGFYGYKERISNQLTYILHRGEESRWLTVYRYRHHWSHWIFVHKFLDKCLSKLNSCNRNNLITKNNLFSRSHVCRLHYCLQI